MPRHTAPSPALTATAQRAQGGWLVRVRGMRGVVIPARTLADAEAEIRKVAHTQLRTGRNARVDIEAVLPTKITSQLNVARDAALKAEQVRDEAAAAWRAVAVTLTDELGLTQQDAAAVMGISRQRISQLLQTSRPSPATKK